MTLLALAARDQGDLAAARGFGERALSINEMSLGADHPDLASTLNNLALVLQAQGELNAAQTMFQRTVSINEAALGPNHPRVATSLNNLAELLRQQGEEPESLRDRADVFVREGKYAEAHALSQRLVAMMEAAHGPSQQKSPTRSTMWP